MFLILSAPACSIGCIRRDSQLSRQPDPHPAGHRQWQEIQSRHVNQVKCVNCVCLRGVADVCFKCMAVEAMLPFLYGEHLFLDRFPCHQLQGFFCPLADMTDRKSTQGLTACRAQSLCAFRAVTLVMGGRVKSVRLCTILAFAQMWFCVGRERHTVRETLC